MKLKHIAMAAAFAVGAAGAVSAQEVSGSVTRFDAAFFAAFQPYTAFDMVLRVPGFTFEAGDDEVRGFSGATGNVLIDGKRPTGKGEEETLLRRIAAADVERIELIRSGTAGIDMQGRTVLANVVVKPRASSRTRVEASAFSFQTGQVAPTLATKFTRREGDRTLELSLSKGREVDEDAGSGPRLWRSPDGVLVRGADYGQEDWTDASKGALGYERPVLGGPLRIDVSAGRSVTRSAVVEATIFPEASVERIAERETLREQEVSGRYQRKFGEAWKLEGLALLRIARAAGEERSDDGESSSSAAEMSRQSESIARAILRRDGPKVSWEFGLEGAINDLDSRSAYSEDGVDIPLPLARAEVSERRMEVSAGSTYRIGPTLTAEAGLRYERSTLTQAESSSGRDLAFLKPRGVLTWQSPWAGQVRAGLERRVSQLDFEDFISSASLTTSVVTAGNPNLRPEADWRASLDWQRAFGRNGSLAIGVRRDRIDSVVDRAPVTVDGATFDSPGNIGKGWRRELQVSATQPLDRLGVKGGMIKLDLFWRDSEVTDPATGAPRRISGEPAREGEVHFTQDLPDWRLRWGVDVDLGETRTDYMFNEIQSEHEGTRYAAFVEYRPSPAWSIRLDLQNLSDADVIRERERHAGLRGSNPVNSLETRALRLGPSFGLSVQREFGG